MGINLVLLFEHSAVKLTKDKQVLASIDELRQDMLNLLRLGGRMESKNKHAIVFEDTALLKADWTITTSINGEAYTIANSSAEIARKQADGTWRYIIDIPFSLNW
jgi:ketosteroid isomerase-like protein